MNEPGAHPAHARAPGARVVVPLAPVDPRRGWLRRLAGAGAPRAIARWEARSVAPPPTIALPGDAARHRRLYLWLASLAAYFEPRGDWIDDNLRATQRVLAALPGLRPLHAELSAAELAARPAPATPAERLVRAALHGVAPGVPSTVKATDVAPVWSWLDVDVPEEPARGD